MSYENQDVMAVFVQLVEAGGDSVSASDQRILRSPVDELGESEAETLAGSEYASKLLTGFGHLGAKGHAFTDPYKIEMQFGSTLEGNYPEASRTFLAFAQTYWTFKLFVMDNLMEGRNSVALEILRNIEVEIAGLFFPTPGPNTVNPKKREEGQRQFFQATGAPIDVNDFFRGNPILIRDRKSGGAGCGMTTFALLVVVVAAISLF